MELGSYFLFLQEQIKDIIIIDRQTERDSKLGGVGPVGVFGGEAEGVGVRSRPGAARTMLRFHSISARPSKQPQNITRLWLAYPLRCIGY